VSRIGKQPILIPAGVTVEVNGALVRVQGPKGALAFECPEGICVDRADGELRVQRAQDGREQRALHGLANKIVSNMVRGVSAGFSKVLEINGVGYRAEAKGNSLQLALGYSHPILFPLPVGVTARVERQTIVTLEAADRQLLGQTAAAIRRLRPVEPYKGKGLKYANEVVKRKAGKAAGSR
jgi:large subunit ribosomal protein L6